MFERIFFCIVLCALISGFEVRAQNILKGTIQLEDGEPASGAVIRALKMDTSTTVSYTLSQEDGSWEMTLYRTDSTLLEFRMFGYGSYYKLLPDPSKVTHSFDVSLSQESFSLDEVTVKGEAYGVSRKGDTLSFRLRTFTTGAERTLGDVIQRLPGMEIRDGSVFYGGERINKMLVQGRDIINANHQLATEGIRADQLKEIKVIENYKEADQQFQTERSEDVAMDVRLKDEEQNKWSGELEALGGYPSSAKVEFNTFNLNDKVGFSGFARANNVGDRILTFRDMMNMVNQEGRRHFRRSSSDFINLVPSELSIGDQVQSNRDGIINFNADINVTEQLKIKGFLMGAYAKRESEMFLRKEYLSDNQVRQEDINETSRTPLGNTMLKMEWNIDSSTYVELNVPASINNTMNDERRTGTFDQMNFNTMREREEWNYSISPFAKMRKKVGRDDIWNMDVRYRKSRQSADVLYADDFPFLSVPVQPNDSMYRIIQDQILETEEFIFNSKYKIVLGDWFVEPSMEYAWEHNAIDYDADAQGAEDFTSNDYLKEQVGDINLRGGYETSDWEIIPSVNVNFLHRNYLVEDQTEDVFAGYGLQIERKFNRAHNLSVSANYGLQYPSLDNIKNTYEIVSSSEVVTGGYPVDLATKGYSASIRYRNFIVQKSTFIFARASYNYNEDVISNYQQNIGDYILSGFTPAPHSQNFSTGIFVGYELDFIPIRIEPDADFSWYDGFTTSLDEETPTQRFDQSYELEFESRWDFPLNAEMGIEYRQQNIRSEESGDQKYSSWEPRIEIEYEAGNFRIESDFSYEISGTEEIESDLYILDIEADYELKGLPLTLKVEAENLLNLDPRERVRSTFDLNYAEVRRYRVFPGYIIAGVEWKF